MKQKQNIVFFFSDQQRADTLGCNGQPLPVTPCLDRFACEDAVNFSNAFTPQPVCGPARAMLQTGLYPTQTGCYRNAVSLPLGQKTLARYLKEGGYQVAYVGKWHLASDEHGNTMKPYRFPRNAGADMMTTGWRRMCWNLPPMDTAVMCMTRMAINWNSQDTGLTA